LEEACVCRGHDSGPIEPDNTPARPARSSLDRHITRSRQGKLTALSHYIDLAVRRASFFGLKKSAAPGVDEMTWAKCAETLEANLVDLGGWSIWAAPPFGVTL
jgi:hypothetical protein